MRCSCSSVGSASKARASRSADGRRRFRLDDEIGKHVGHQRLRVEHRAERGPVMRVPRGLGDALTHDRRRSEHTVEPGVIDHLDDGAHAASLVADPRTPRVDQLDLARRVGAVAELVLQALDADRVAAAVGPPARNQKARQTRGCLREHQERVRHRRRAEPLVSRQRVATVAGRARDRGVGPDVGAALLLGHRHPAGRAVLLGRRTIRRVVGARREAGLPLGCELGGVAQRRNGRIGHRDRADVTTVDLIPGDHLRRARRARRRVGRPTAPRATRGRRPPPSARGTRGGR